jgi:pectinesterase
VALGRRERGRYYHARCNFSGSVEFLCPRGWCYVTDSNFYAYDKATAVWHEGRPDPHMKFVMRNCRFDGAKNFDLGRYFVDGQFYFLDCKFSDKMRDMPIQRELPAPKGGVSAGTPGANAHLYKEDIRGEYSYFHNCHRDGGNFAWFANNLSCAPGAPRPDQVTAEWTFDGKWNPENESCPVIQELRRRGRQIVLVFSEAVAVKGKPRLKMCGSGVANYVSGSGADRLLFELQSDSVDDVCSVDLNGGAIIACQASALLRPANLPLHSVQRFRAN